MSRRYYGPRFDPCTGRPMPYLSGPVHQAWPALSSWQTQLTKGNVRIGDTERDQAAATLGDHYTNGRLEKDEYDVRLDRVFEARTWGDLAPLFRDLPGTPRSSVAQVPRAPRVPAVPPYPKFPMLPALLLLIGLSVLLDWGVVVFLLGLAGLFYLRHRQRQHHLRRHRGGPWRPASG